MIAFLIPDRHRSPDSSQDENTSYHRRIYYFRSMSHVGLMLFRRNQSILRLHSLSITKRLFSASPPAKKVPHDSKQVPLERSFIEYQERHLLFNLIDIQRKRKDPTGMIEEDLVKQLLYKHNITPTPSLIRDMIQWKQTPG